MDRSNQTRQGIEGNNIISKMLRTNLGAIRPFFDDVSVVEIMLNADKKLWIERLGEEMKDTGIEIEPEKSLQLIQLIASVCGTTVKDSNPIISAELPFFGSRFEGIIPPVSVNPIFSIRQPAVREIPLEEYLEKRIITQRQYERIDKAVVERENILLVGGTGTGKTTMINAILQRMVKTKANRIVIMEDTRELRCNASNIVFLRTQDDIGVTQQRLLKSSMRLRPDRIVVGEVRDRAALDIVKAWLTGHPGGIASVHGSSAYGGLVRMEQLIMESGAIHQEKLIAETVHLLIYIERTPTGRVVKEMANVRGYENGKYQLDLIY